MKLRRADKVNKLKDILYYLPLNKLITECIFTELFNLISYKKQEKIKCYHFDIDKKLSLYSDLLVRVIACENLYVNNSDLLFHESKYGKPYIKGYPDFHYNISHTRNAIVLVISTTPVGVDIEKIKKAALSIAKRFFAANEQDYIFKDNNDFCKRFYEVWTKKEAYIKYIGKGLSIPLNSFDILDENISKQIHTYERNDYIISVCSKSPNPNFNVIELSEIDLENLAIKCL